MKIVLKIIKWIVLIVLGILTAWFLISLGKYRIGSGGEGKEAQGNVIYQFLELNVDNRYLFESVMGKSIVRLDGYPPFFVSKEDWKKLWPENPHDMNIKGYTIKAKIRSKLLFFGGVMNSKVISTEVVNEKPDIRK